MAIGTAVKKVPSLAVATPQLPAQAIIKDKDTWVSSDNNLFGISREAVTGSAD